MSPEQADALALEIIRSAALVSEEDGDGPSYANSTPLPLSEEEEAVAAVERAMGLPCGSRIASPQSAAAPIAEMTDEEWFAAHPGRTARLRNALPTDQRPYWVAEGQALMASVRRMNSYQKPSVGIHPAEAFSLPVLDADDAILAATRAAIRAGF